LNDGEVEYFQEPVSCEEPSETCADDGYVDRISLGGRHLVFIGR
jgi:hypothetical protein